MPCICWFDPPEESKKLLKSHCQAIVDEIKRLEKHGDLTSFGLHDVQHLLEHLYTGKCDERK